MPSYQRVPIFMAPDLADTVSVPAPGTVGHVLTVTSTSPLVLAWQAGGGGGTSDHAALSNLAWTASGHTGTAGRLAGFSGAGAATTYASIAQHIGKPKAARAVGAAVGRNPVSFVVPCHRVLGAGGALTGYHWGLTRKQAIIGWEAGRAAAEL